ncbi:MAG: polysaccharide biosynthesis tyrosine autokinase [Porticoccaceae bacterium]
MSQSSSSTEGYRPDQTPFEDEIDLRQLLAMLIDGRQIIAITLVITVLLALVYVFMATPIYRANGIIQVEDNAPGVPGLDDMAEIFATESSSATELHVIKSRLVVGQVVDELGLAIQVEPQSKLFLPTPSNINDLSIEVSQLDIPDYLIGEALTLRIETENSYSLWFDNQKLIQGVMGELALRGDLGILVNRVATSEEIEFTLSKAGRLQTILDLQNQLQVSEKGKDTGIIEISIEGPDRKKIAQIVDAVSANYYFQNVQRMAEEAEKSLTFLDQQIPKVQRELMLSEDKLNQYQNERSSVDLSLEAETALDVLVQIEADISTMAINEADISRRFTPQHPNYISFKRQQRNLLSEREKINRKIENLPETQKEVLRLKREFEVNQAIFIALQNKRQELSILKASTVGNVRILDKAEVLPEPVAPKKSLIVVLAALLGMMAGVVFVAMRNFLKPGIKDPNDLIQNGLTVQVMVPLSENEKSAPEVRSLLSGFKKGNQETNQMPGVLAKTHPADLAIEAIRSLRTSLYFSMLEANNKRVMISSASPGVGKSFVSTNLAAVTAQADQKVLLIDADMRKGLLHKRFGCSGNVGLSDVLKGAKDPKQVMQSTGIPGFDFIPRGKAPSNPSELLMGPQFNQLLAGLEAEYDLILIDTPPILAVTDASIIGKYAGASLMVARFESCTVRQVLAANERFDLQGIKIDGVIFNCMEKKSSSYYYDYGYYEYRYDNK